jgi:hypothetical protein
MKKASYVFSATIVAAALAAGQAARADDATAANTNVVQQNATAPSTNALAPIASFTEHGGFGIGALFGEPTGLSMKYWFSDITAADLGTAWSFEDHGSFQLHGDFLWHKFDLFHVPRGELPVYFGVGGRVKIPDHGDTRAGVRVPIGIAYEFPDVPLELFGEVAPILDLTPSTEGRLNGGVGIRYYFR